MSDSFAPDEPVTRYEMKSGFRLLWPIILLGAIPVGWAVSLVPDIVSGKDAPFPLRIFGFACCLAVFPLGNAAWLNRRRLKWVEAADRGGVRWSAHGREWHRGWDRITDVGFESTYLPQPDGTMGLCYQTMTVTFDDGARLCLKSWECASFWYLGFRDYVERMRGQAEASARGIAPGGWCQTERGGAAGGDTRFGPLFIDSRGVEWDGAFHPWEQIEGYEIQQGFLIIRTVDGDEFLRRTADLGDWRTAIARLDAAAGRMAGRRTGAGR